MAMRPTARPIKAKGKPTSWEEVGDWYHGIVGEGGHYYHQHVIMPGLLKMLDIKPSAKGALLDLACGQGILCRHLPESFSYTGVDLSPTLIKAATAMNQVPSRKFLVGDVSKKLPLPSSAYTHATIVLALQNIEAGNLTLRLAAEYLQQGGKLVLVLNHPCFRIPRQSSWGMDDEKKMRYRRIDRYFSEMKIPIQMHPSQGKASKATWSFHHPLSDYCKWLAEAGFYIANMEEWCSNKQSTGKCSVMENRSRSEFPLFLAISAVKR